MFEMKFPKHIEIEITNHCQLKCVMCPNRVMTRPKGFMSCDILDKILSEAKGRTRSCYMHMIGEPLLHKQLLPMIQKVSSCGIRTSISTNAVLLDEDMAISLLNSPLDELTLALDSMRKEVYERYRVGSDFDTVVENIDRAISLRRGLPNSRTQIEMQLIVMVDNVDDVPEFRAKYMTMLEGIGKLSVKGYSTFAGKVEDLGPDQTPPRRFTCGKLNSSIAVHWNGDLVVCCRDFDGVTVVGNVHQNSILQIFNSDRYNEMRQDMRNRNYEHLVLCKDC